jgi:hypothetical protein
MRNFHKDKNELESNQNFQKINSQNPTYNYMGKEKEVFCLSPQCITKLKQSHLLFHEEVHAKSNSYPQIEVTTSGDIHFLYELFISTDSF